VVKTVLEDERDREMLKEMPRRLLLDLLALHVRNIWRVDGLYFLGIEDEYGTEPATKIDADCWGVMGKIEARQLKRILNVEEVDPQSFLRLLRNTSWALDVIGKEYDASEDRVIFRVTECGTQQTRLRKDLPVFPCRRVRHGYLEAFARELNSEVEMVCRACPPGERPEGTWCEWEFRFSGR
jgi:hypothetical protein